MRKTLAFIFAAAVLSGCGLAAPEMVMKSHLPSDYSLSCDDIIAEINTLGVNIRHIGEPEGELWGATAWQQSAKRDFRARVTVLRGLGASKGCFAESNGGTATTNAPAQAPKEKSRVIICNDDQSCVVE